MARNKRTFWLKPDTTFGLLDACHAVDPEFGILCTVLNYTGLRLGEALAAMECERVESAREFAYIVDTTSPVGLPAALVVAALANHPRSLNRSGRLFRFHDGGRLRDLLKDTCGRAGIELPRRTAFHVFGTITEPGCAATPALSICG